MNRGDLYSEFMTRWIHHGGGWGVFTMRIAQEDRHRGWRAPLSTGGKQAGVDVKNHQRSNQLLKLGMDKC